MEEKSWLSAHIHIDKYYEELLAEVLKPTCEQFIQDNVISEYFFIRYWEGGAHIRLRLLICKSITHIDFVKITLSAKIKSFFSSKNYEINYKLLYESYIPEMHRYGGRECIKIAEKYFFKSSRIIMDVFKENLSSWQYSYALSSAIQLHVIFARILFVEKQKALSFFENLHINWLAHSIKKNEKGNILSSEVLKVTKYFVSSYDKQKETINYIVKSAWNEDVDSSWFLSWKETCIEVKEGINYLNDRKLIEFPSSTSPNNQNDYKELFFLFDSYLHMNNNRLGIYLRDESYLYFIISNALKMI